MASPPPVDPRIAGDQTERGVLPTVSRPGNGVSPLVLAAALAIFGLLLFLLLDARRNRIAVPPVKARAADRAGASMGAAVPPLYIPPALPVRPALPLPAPIPSPVMAPPPPPQIIYQVAPSLPGGPVLPANAPPSRPRSDPALVFDGAPVAVPERGDADRPPARGGAAQSVAGPRARAGQFANRGTTVVQGTLIPAVLETGLNSTSPGLARAMVTQDIRGFDGSRILIPRGSRVIGEYRSDTAAGQNRALVNWVRLIRPDGTTIAVGSPASDPVGRGGIKAQVNSHFFERFGNAILQSALDVGVNLARRRAGDTVIVAVPGGSQQVSGQTDLSRSIPPTLKVRPGTSISIFVARDLDFTGAGKR